jgi:flagellar biosynthesis component FlhA
LTAAGRPIVVVSSPTVRAPLRQILGPHIAGVVVLGYNEIVDGLDVQSVGLVQIQNDAAPSPEMVRSPQPIGA